MKKIEVLVATMRRDDLSLVSEMNIQSDAVIANQSDSMRLDEETFDFGHVKMITTPTKGVGLNRNIALMASEAEIVLFADDDIRYYDGAMDGVVKAFEECPDADIIAFSLDIVKNGEITEKRRWKKKKLGKMNAFKYGTCVLAARRDSLVKKNITFNLLFGGGCIYSSGEDSKFLSDCLKSGLKMYSHPHVLGRCSKDVSSWFKGYNEKFFYDKGVWTGFVFPRTKHLMKWYFVYRFKSRTELSSAEMLRLMNKGIKNGQKLIPYQED